jgi:hypothetical protein
MLVAPRMAIQKLLRTLGRVFQGFGRILVSVLIVLSGAGLFVGLNAGLRLAGI